MSDSKAARTSFEVANNDVLMLTLMLTAITQPACIMGPVSVNNPSCQAPNNSVQWAPTLHVCREMVGKVCLLVLCKSQPPCPRNLTGIKLANVTLFPPFPVPLTHTMPIIISMGKADIHFKSQVYSTDHVSTATL